MNISSFFHEAWFIIILNSRYKFTLNDLSPTELILQHRLILKVSKINIYSEYFLPINFFYQKKNKHVRRSKYIVKFFFVRMRPSYSVNEVGQSNIFAPVCSSISLFVCEQHSDHSISRRAMKFSG